MADIKEENPAGEVSSDTDDNAPAVNEKALLRKLDAHLLPAVGLLYLLSFLDRSNGKKESNKRSIGTGDVISNNV